MKCEVWSLASEEFGNGVINRLAIEQVIKDNLNLVDLSTINKVVQLPNTQLLKGLGEGKKKNLLETLPEKGPHCATLQSNPISTLPQQLLDTSSS